MNGKNSQEVFTGGSSATNDLAESIVMNPRAAANCDWSKFDGWNWARILSARPEFADRCNWSKLEGGDWSCLLRAQPQFAGKCDWTKLGRKTALWRFLLRAQPKFAAKCPWTALSADEGADLISAQPALARVAKSALKRAGRTRRSRKKSRDGFASGYCSAPE